MSAGKLPEGWVKTTLSSAISNQGLISDGDWIESKDQDPNGSVRLIQLADIGDGYFKDKSKRYMTPEKAKILNCTYLFPGDVLVARMPDPLGRACVFPGINQDAVTVVDVCLLRTVPDSAISNHIIKYWINSPALRTAIVQNASGSTRKRITRKKLEKLDIPLPPLAEQKFIAEKLDTLLAQVDSTKARLEKIPKILKRFRQAVLASAVNGILTKQYRSREIFGTQISLGELILNGPQNGLYKPSKFYGDGIRIIRIDSFYDGKILNFDELKRIDITEVEKNKWLLQENDILINRVNSIEYLGKCAHVKTLSEDTVFESNIMRFSVDTMLISPEYLILFLCSTAGIRELRKNAKLAVNQASINQTDVKNCKLMLPILAEQHEIVRRVEQLFAYADTIEKQVNNALARVSNLTQSILAKAFRGELTAQWRAENPELISGENSAAALLEKIKAERAASTGKKASRKKS